MTEHPRRRYLQLFTAVATATLSGCSSGDDSTDTATTQDTATDTATPTRPASGTATSTPDFTAAEAWSVDRLSGQVDTLLLPEVGPIDDPAGPLYAATQAGEVARIAPPGGRHEWTVAMRGEELGYPPLAPVGDAVYAVSETFTDQRLANHVEALDPATGDARWTFEDRAFLRVLGVVDDLVVLAGEYILAHPEEIGPEEPIRGDGTIYGLDRATGEERWTVDVPGLRGTDVADHGVYALESPDDGAHQLSLRAVEVDGTERWRVDTGTVEPGAPLAADDLLLAGAAAGGDAERGAVGRYDPADGSLMWTAGDWERGPDELALQDGIIHAGSRPFLALGHQGFERYRVQGFGVPEVPATPESLYNGAGSHIPAVDRDVGEIRWRYRPEDYEYTHIRAVLADHVAVDRGIGPDSEVVLLGETSGEVVGTFETPGHYWGMVGAGRRLFAGVDSDVVAYDITVDAD